VDNERYVNVRLGTAGVVVDCSVTWDTNEIPLAICDETTDVTTLK